MFFAFHGKRKGETFFLSLSLYKFVASMFRSYVELGHAKRDVRCDGEIGGKREILSSEREREKEGNEIFYSASGEHFSVAARLRSCYFSADAPASIAPRSDYRAPKLPKHYGIKGRKGGCSIVHLGVTRSDRIPRAVALHRITTKRVNVHKIVTHFSRNSPFNLLIPSRSQ